MDAQEYPQFERAVEGSQKRLATPEVTQAIAMLAIAEAIHRLAQAIEQQQTQR